MPLSKVPLVPPEPTPRRVTVQISTTAAKRLDEVALQTALTRPRLLEHLVLRLSARELVRLLKAEKPTPTRYGRPKQSIFKKPA